MIARLVVFAVAIVTVGQLLLCAGFFHTLRNRGEDGVRSKLDLAERTVATRVDQVRAEASRVAAQAGRDPTLAKALSARSDDAIAQTLRGYAKRAQAGRALLVRSNGVIVADVAGEGSMAPAGGQDWGAALPQAFSGVGRASGFVPAGGAMTMWTAVPSGFDPSLATVLMLPIESIIASDFEHTDVAVRLALRSSLVHRSGTTADVPSDHLRQLYLSDATNDPVTVELMLPPEASGALLREVIDTQLPGFLAGLALATVAAIMVGFFMNRSLARLRSAVLAQKVGQLKPLPLEGMPIEIGPLVRSFNGLLEAILQHEKRVLRTAYRDPLTSLPNRALYLERLGEAIQAQRKARRSLAVLLIDAEQVAGVREALGDAVGDWLLQALASRLRNVLRGADRLIQSEAKSPSTSPVSPTLARFGGDLFSVLLPGCSMEQAERVARRLDEVLAHPFENEGQRIACTVRIGVAACPEHARDAEGLMRMAEIAMQEARRRQTSVVPFELDHQLERDFQTSLGNDLRRALDAGELQLRFQPKISLKGESRLMVETLVRWQHPEKGLLTPDQFVPIAEKAGVIGHLTRWVADQGLRQIAVWQQRDGLDVRMSMNVSSLDVMTTEFASYLIERLGHHQLPAEALTIEIRESSFVLDPQSGRSCLQMLDQQGVSLAIDDFGTGFSTLEYLRELPVRAVKIDRRFVSAMESDKSARVIVRSAIELAHSLRLQVVAEGVENAETLQSLRTLDCDFAQGYFFGKPLSAQDFSAWLEHQSRRFNEPVTETAAETAAETAEESSAALEKQPVPLAS